jgi:hypothetical protein
MSLPRRPIAAAAAAAIALALQAPVPLAAQQPTATAAPRSPWPAAIIPDPGQRGRRELLISHGVNPDTTAIIAFLREGFRPGALPAGLPRNPPLKSEVTNAAIEELGVTGARAAVPVLIDIASRRLPPGAERIMLTDFEMLPLTELDRQVTRMEQVLALNAIVALGLIGEPEAIPAIRDQIEREKNGTATLFITRGAIALGQLGSADGVPYLLDLAARVDSEDTPEAFRVLFVLTGRNYGVTDNTALARRRTLVAEARTWWTQNAATFRVDRVDVMRRLNAPIAPVEVDGNSLRALLRRSRNVEDFDGRLVANRRLSATAKDHFDDLRAIVEDKHEDIDIRRAAIRWLAVADPSRARRIVRRQFNDENPAIAETARAVDEDIDSLLNR